jgi:polyhydroxybutyrate depolymerase
VKQRALALFVAALLAPGAAANAATLETLTLERPDGPRPVLLAAPAAEAPGLHPLVIVLHGHGGSARQVLGQGRGKSPLSLWLDHVDRDGLIVAAPDGRRGGDGKPGWNDCRRDARTNPPVDDVGLIGAIIDRAVAAYHADPARVYLIGMSNGGMMTFRAAIELGSRLAAFATIGASMAADSLCPAPTHPLPALIVAGSADPVVPYAGGAIGHGHRGTVIGVEASVEVWRRLDGLPETPDRVEPLPHRDAADTTRATRTVWGGDPSRLQVELLRIDGGGHVEPSVRERVSRLWRRFVGAQNADVETVDEAWAFFRDRRATR